MKSFEHLVLSHLKSIADPLLDSLQFAYRANRSVDDMVNMALHFILQHLDSPGTYARILSSFPNWECPSPHAGGSQTSCPTGGSISDGDESASMEEIDHLVSWFSLNNYSRL